MPNWTDKNNVSKVNFADLSIKAKLIKGVNEGVKKVHLKFEREGINKDRHLLSIRKNAIHKANSLLSPLNLFSGHSPLA